MRHLFTLCCLLLLAAQSLAQDVILQTNGEELPGKVLAITPDSITYLSGTAGRTDTLRLAASSIFLIRYANGTKEVLHQPTASPAPALLSKEEAYSKGRLDARKYYKASGAFWGTYAATVVTGYGGPITGVVVAATKPPVRKLVVPDAQFLQDPNYVAGYRQQAQNKKIGSAAAGLGAGVATLAAVVVVIFAAFVTHM